MTKMAASMVESGEDAFRKIFKFYKRRDPPPDYKDVIDFLSAAPGGKVVPADLDSAAVTNEEAARVGLRPVSEWRAFGLQGYPGFLLISDPFLGGSQALWLHRCLRFFPQKPNLCNLDLHMDPTQTRDLWGQSAAALSSPPGKNRPKTLLEKLRWVTLGYHYDWETKTYSASSHTPFPADLHSLSSRVAAACGFQQFSSEAAILNFYRPDSSLGIHVDESELDLSRPLLSFSFGQSAIFLLGGRRRQEAPAAMFLHSGDVVVMSGRSRLLYHAVPRILPPPPGRRGRLEPPGPGTPPGGELGPVPDADWAVCDAYIQNSRVNVTVRQVMAPGGEMAPGEKRKRSESDDVPET